MTIINGLANLKSRIKEPIFKKGKEKMKDLICILHMIQNHFNNNSQDPTDIIKLFERNIELEFLTTDIHKFEFLSNDDTYGTLKAYYRDKINNFDNGMAELINIEDFSQFLKENDHIKNFGTLFEFVKTKFSINCHSQSPMNYALRIRLLFAYDLCQNPSKVEQIICLVLQSYSMLEVLRKDSNYYKYSKTLQTHIDPIPMEPDVAFTEKLLNLSFSQKSKALILRSVWYYIYSKTYNQTVINDFKKLIQKILASISANFMK